MNAVKKYLDSGILESYCLGMTSEEENRRVLEMCSLYPEVLKYLKKLQLRNEKALLKHQRQAPPSSKKAILSEINAQEALRQQSPLSPDQSLNQYIPLSEHSNPKAWMELTQHLALPKKAGNIFLKEIYKDERQMLAVLWVRKQIPPEVHEHLDESFLILKGNCTCRIDQKAFQLKSGDFMRMPPDSTHEFIVDSDGPAKVILSRVRLY